MPRTVEHDVHHGMPVKDNDRIVCSQHMHPFPPDKVISFKINTMSGIFQDNPHGRSRRRPSGYASRACPSSCRERISQERKDESLRSMMLRHKGESRL